MFLQRVARGLKSGPVVALLAVVSPRSACKLAAMLIAMTVGAQRKTELEPRLVASRNMAGGARHFLVRKDERESGLRMIGDAESGWAPALFVVAAFAAVFVGALGKLAAVRVGLVAVGAMRGSDGRFEIATLMTLQTRNLLVFAAQWKAGFGVIEFLGEIRFCPRRSVVAALAGLLEFTFVRIAVAVCAVSKFQPFVAWLPV